VEALSDVDAKGVEGGQGGGVFDAITGRRSHRQQCRARPQPALCCGRQAGAAGLRRCAAHRRAAPVRPTIGVSRRRRGPRAGRSGPSSWPEWRAPVLHPGPLFHQVGASHDLAASHPGPVIGHPGSGQEIGGQQLGRIRASTLSVLTFAPAMTAARRTWATHRRAALGRPTRRNVVTLCRFDIRSCRCALTAGDDNRAVVVSL